MNRSPRPSPPETLADDVAAALRRHPPRLDELSHARIAQRLAALPPPAEEPLARPAGSPRRWRGWVAAAGLAAAAAAGLWWHRAASTTPRQALPVATAPASVTQWPAPPPNAARRKLRLGDAEAILFGDAAAQAKTSAHSFELHLEAGTVHITTGEEPLVLRTATVLITASRAAFAASASGATLHLQVVRGAVQVRRIGELSTIDLVAPGQLRLALREEPAAAAGSTAATPAPSPTPPIRPHSAPATLDAPAPDPAPIVREPDDTTGPARLEALYQRAEAALARGDTRTGRELLEDLVASAPRDRRADAARFDLARLAERAGQAALAKRWLGEILSSGSDELVREPAHQLLCRLLAAEAARSATECLRQLRRAHPSSPADAETLAALARREHAEAGCAASMALYAEYVRRYPAGAFAAEATAALRTCQERPL